MLEAINEKEISALIIAGIICVNVHAQDYGNELSVNMSRRYIKLIGFGKRTYDTELPTITLHLTKTGTINFRSLDHQPSMSDKSS